MPHQWQADGYKLASNSRNADEDKGSIIHHSERQSVRDYTNRTDQQPIALESENNSDSEYELCFVVEDVEFLTYKQGFI